MLFPLISPRRMIIAAAVVCCLGQTAAQARDAFDQLEPAFIRAEYDRATTGLAAIPDLVRDAFLAAEDRNYFNRPTARSLITRQIARQYVKGGSGPFDRAFRLQAMQTAIAGEMDHDEIVTWYLGSVYLGQQCYGVQDATLGYFGKTLDQLTPAEVALLAALPKAPSRHDPIREPDRALERRNFVLDRMHEAGIIAPEQAMAAKGDPLGILSPPGACPGPPARD